MNCNHSPMMVKSTVYSKGGHSMRNIVNLIMMMIMTVIMTMMAMMMIMMMMMKKHLLR